MEKWVLGNKDGFNANTVYIDDGTKHPDGICQMYGIPVNTTLDYASRHKEFAPGLYRGRIVAAAPEMFDLLERLVENDLSHPELNRIAQEIVQRVNQRRK